MSLYRKHKKLKKSIWKETNLKTKSKNQSEWGKETLESWEIVD